MNELVNNVALVTGAGRGIGAEIAREFSASGAIVVGLDTDSIALKSTLDAISGETLGLEVDVTHRENVQAAVSEVLAKYGKIDILINCAGITRDNMFFRMSPEEWNQVIDVNLNGVFHITQAVQASMVENRYGRIVFISSRSALGNRGQANYAATKAAVQGLAKTLAIELGPLGITVNVVAPGFIDTEMTRAIVSKTGQSWEELSELMKQRAAVGRLGTPSDIANAVSFFASKKSGFVTGQVLYVAGAPTG